MPESTNKTPESYVLNIPLAPESCDQPFILNAGDGRRIYGTLNHARGEKKAKKLLISAHGLTGYPEEWLHTMAMRWFTARGYDVVRFSFYHPAEDARSLQTCLLADHINDLKVVVGYHGPDYDKVYIAGHSYGGMTTVCLNPEVNAVALWDSTLYPYSDWWVTNTRAVPEWKAHFLSDHIEVLANEAMIEEAAQYTLRKMRQLARAMKAPVMLAIAELHYERPGQKQVFESFPDPKTLETVQAGHDFFEDDKVFELLQKTEDWFEKF